MSAAAAAAAAVGVSGMAAAITFAQRLSLSFPVLSSLAYMRRKEKGKNGQLGLIENEEKGGKIRRMAKSWQGRHNIFP